MLPPETQEQVRKSKLYLEVKDKVKEIELNKLYEYIMKHGTIPKITATGVLLIVTDK